MSENNDGFHSLRKPCLCGCTVGRIRRAGLQDVCRCADCDRYQYNAPRSETGLPVEPIKPVAIKSKWAGSCKTCGATHDVGQVVAWTPKERGVQCLSCGGLP